MATILVEYFGVRCLRVDFDTAVFKEDYDFLNNTTILLPTWYADAIESEIKKRDRTKLRVDKYGVAKLDDCLRTRNELLEMLGLEESM